MQSKHEPRFVLIEGPPGIGKSALLNEAARQTGWWRVNVYLDPEDQHTPGYGAVHLLRTPQRYQAPQDKDELFRWVQVAADAISEPIVVAFEDLQWLDPMSADIIYQSVRETEFVPMFNLVTMRASCRSDLTRFRRLAQTEGEALHIVLKPLSVSEIQEVIIGHTGLPVSERLCARIQEEISGFPFFVAHVAQWLADEPAGRGRRLTDAIAAVGSEAGPAEQMAQTMAEQLALYEPGVREALEFIVLSDDGLTPAQLHQLLDVPPDIAGLEGTCLLAGRGPRRRLRLQHHVIADGIRTQLQPHRRAEMHRRLAQVVPEPLLQSAAALQLELQLGSAAPEAAEQLTSELLARAEQRDCGQALRCARAAMGISTEEHVVQTFVRTALRAKSIEDLRLAEHALTDLPPGALRSGVAALLHFAAGDLDAGYAELERVSDLSSDCVDTLVVFAEAVASAGQRSAALGTFGRSCDLLKAASSALAAAEAQVRSPTLLADLRNVHLIIEMWHQLEAGFLTAGAQDRLSALLQQVSADASTRRALVTQRGLRGALHRQTGSGAAAVEDLTWVLQRAEHLDEGLATYVQVQLAHIYFDAGLWGEAHTAAAGAAEEVLGESEDVLSMAAYSIGALVPHARGEGAAWERVLDVVTSIGKEYGAIAQAPKHYTLTWGALAAGDHERAAAHLLRLHSTARWWRSGITSAVLLARAQYYSGCVAELAPQLLELPAAAAAGSESLTRYVTEHIRGLRAAAQDASRAWDHLGAALEAISAQPPIRPGLLVGDGGGYRIYRALLAMDCAQLVIRHRAELARHVASVEVLAGWALQLWRSCGAEGLADQTEEIIRELTGIRPPRPQAAPRRAPAGLPEWISEEAMASLQILTSRERDIALMAGEGLSNNEMAERLVISVRTVESHMSSILAKLRLSSRRELFKLLLPQSL
ncbi:LuxR family transcriptional regulator [Nesterenkonia sp.]|uniref:helix-turn-helix transcriptional regulator n=1 Tax=Nesterenkonia sp. TaxID=704201 RepID=UPI002621EB8C|nr:LuxR family transcriptional regulator [Nesterenkonia sp.]